jgi:MinD-like ATPase involved in chromosome partitioning or flagellar assembly
VTAVIAITSGKANVGRSLLSANLAHYLNQKGYRTGVLVAGSDRPLWGVAPNTTWPNIIGGRLAMDHAIERDIFGTDLMVTTGHGHALGNLSTRTADHLDDPLGILDAYAYLIVDMAAGTSSPAIACCLSATETIMVLTPETPSLTSGYEWLAKLAQFGFNGPVNMVLNKVRKPAMAQTVYTRFRDLAQKRLKIQTNLWGSVNLDKDLNPGDHLQQPLKELLPRSKLLKAICTVGDRLLAEQPPENQTMPLSIFWQHFIQLLGSLPVLPFTPPAPETPRPESPKPFSGVDTAQAPISEEPAERSADQPTLRDLARQMSAIFEELKAIRKLLEGRPLSQPPVPPGIKQNKGEEITIDFDDFVTGQEEEDS